ncbi:MAG TPA: type II toxin-antitoxin system HicA family toxin [bacterium]|nr:type II toxin-antitoxin system HicA family toxin [bacterium]
MSAKLKLLSGSDVVKALTCFGFEIFSRSGSHIKLRRLGAQGEKQTLVVPSHDELDAGTLRAIIRQASRYIPEEELRKAFYND